MRKPQDPRNHGLNEPVRVHSREQVLRLGINYSSPVSLDSIIKLWNKAVKDHESQGHRIADGPFVTSSMYLTYKYEWDNLTYDAEKAEYDALVASYEERLESFLKKEEEDKLPLPHNLDKKIERAKQRLANLEAMRDGKPLPFPE